MVDSWNVGGLFCPGKQRGLVAEYALERGESSCFRRACEMKLPEDPESTRAGTEMK